jgi:sigma-B regulation protein RsbU (phosphoserine phosphatase)
MSRAGDQPLLELRFPARADRMAPLRASLRGLARHCDFDAASTEDIVLAVGEVCQNIIQHGYPDTAAGDIVITILRDSADLTFRVSDDAPPFDPARVHPRALDDVRPGGLGTHFIRELMDSVEFRPAADGVGNVLEMTKKGARKT